MREFPNDLALFKTGKCKYCAAAVQRPWQNERSIVLKRLVIILVLASATVYAQPASRSVAQLQHDIDAILASPLLEHGFWGVVVKPVDRDETWYLSLIHISEPTRQAEISY